MFVLLLFLFLWTSSKSFLSHLFNNFLFFSQSSFSALCILLLILTSKDNAGGKLSHIFKKDLQNRQRLLEMRLGEPTQVGRGGRQNPDFALHVTEPEIRAVLVFISKHPLSGVS